MLCVTVEEDKALIVLSKESRDPCVLLATDDARKLKDALLAAATNLELHMKTSGKLIVRVQLMTEVWEASVGYFDNGVAIRFSNPGQLIPLPPAVARHLADRLQSAINAAETGITIRTNTGDPLREFSTRPVLR